MPWLALAAALVLVTLGVYAVTSSAPTSTPLTTTAGNGKADGSVETIASELGQAMRHYENAMAELDRLANANDGQIDPTLAKMLQTQLDALGAGDWREPQGAGERSRQRGRRATACSTRSGARSACCRPTVTLMNEMRQGNPDGAVQAGSILNKKG